MIGQSHPGARVPADREASGPIPHRRMHLDALAALLFVALSVGYSAVARGAMDPRFFALPAGNDVWFEGDLPTVADLVLHRWSDHGRQSNHPLFALLTTVPFYVFTAIGWNDAQRLLAFTMAAAACWSAAVFCLLRLATASRGDAVVFTLLAHVTAAAIFWLPTTDTYVLGSATLLAPLIVLAIDRRRTMGEGWFVTASALSLSVTITNWSSGIIAALFAHPVRRAVQISANALALVVILWGVQKAVIPSVPFFLGPAQSRFVFPEAAGGPVPIARTLLFHSAVMPAVRVVSEPKWGTRLSVQAAPLGSSGVTGVAATAGWAVLLGGAAVGIRSGWRRSRLVPALFLTTVAQCALHLCYGEETFLYTMHVAPLLVACAGSATCTPHRRWITPLAVILTVLLAFNNLSLFARSIRFFESPAHISAGLDGR